MGSYLSNTPAQQEEMLKAAGFRDFEDLFGCIPQEDQLGRPLDLPRGRSEMEVRGAVESMAARNRVFPHVFRGAGAYRHYIPAIVKRCV